MNTAWDMVALRCGTRQYGPLDDNNNTRDILPPFQSAYLTEGKANILSHICSTVLPRLVPKKRFTTLGNSDLLKRTFGRFAHPLLKYDAKRLSLHGGPLTRNGRRAICIHK